MAIDNKVSLVISATDQTQAAFNSIKNSMGSVQSVAATLGATLSAGAFVAFVKGAIDAADEMNDLSAKVGIGIKELAGYKLAAEQSGTSLESVAKGIKGLATYFNEHSDRLKAAGITAKTADEAMIQLADTFAAMPDGLQKTTLATQLFGKAGMEMIPMLNLGSQGLQEAKDKAAAYGEKMAELAPKADKFNDLLSELKLASSGAGISMATQMMPGLISIASAMGIAAEEAGLAKAAIVGLGGAMNAGFVAPFERMALQVRTKMLEMGQSVQIAQGNWAAAAKTGELLKTLYREIEIAAGGDGKPSAAPTSDTGKTPVEKQAEAMAKAKALLGANEEAAKKAVDTYKQLTQSIAEYQAKLDAQGEKQGNLTKADELAIQAKLKLNVAEQARLKPALDKIAADERELALQEALNKRQDDAIAAAEKETASIAAQVIAQNEQNETIGLTKAQIDALEASRLDAQITAKQTLLDIFSETDGRSAQIEEIKAQIDALQELKSAKLAGAARQTIADNIKKTNEEWQRFTDDIERSLTDALMRGFEGGKGAGKNFLDSLKNTLETAALKVVVQALISPVMGTVQGAFGGGSSGGSSLGGISGNPFQSWTGSSMGYGIANSAQWLSSGSTVGPAAPGSIGSLFSGAGQYANWQYGLAGLGGGLLGGAIGGQTGSTLGGIGAGIGMGIGGPPGALIGSIAGGLLGGLFGGGGEDPHNNTDSSSVGFKLSKSGVAGFGTGYYADSTTGFNGYAPFSSTYGQTSGSGRWGDNVPLPQATIGAINTAAAQLFTGGASLASGLGLDPHIVDSAAVASGTFATVEAALSELSDSIVTKVIPNIKDFQQANEKLGDTATRLVAEFNLTNVIAKMRGQTGTQAFGSGLAGRDQLVQLLGGISTASSSIGSYYQNFYTDAERKKNAQGEISATLKSLGINQEVSTREQYRALVEAQDLTVESGRKMYASLISIADAFAGITDVATAAAAATNNLSTDRFKTRADYIFAQQTGIMPHYAAGGDHAGGWAVVGENGPELANLGPSRVYSHNNSRALLDTSALQNEISALRSDLRAGQAAMAHSLKIMEKKVKQWDGDGMPAVRA